MAATTGRSTLLSLTAISLLGCAHTCPTNEPPEANWAEGIACYHQVELAEHPPSDRLGCYRLALGPTYLPNHSTRGQSRFIPNPEIIELTAEWYSVGRIHSGFLVRTPTGSIPWVDNGVWRPTRTGGAIIDLGTGCSGLVLFMNRNRWGYSGHASTYQDISYDSARAAADLWPVSCAKMPLNPADDDFSSPPAGILR
jgi:hypothetical protein